jgi:hypothetical protein
VLLLPGAGNVLSKLSEKLDQLPELIDGSAVVPLQLSREPRVAAERAAVG